MPRSPNAQIAVDMFSDLRIQYGLSKTTAWQGIARLLMSCNVWNDGWEHFHDVVVYRERNDFKLNANGQPNTYLTRAEGLTSYLAQSLGVPRAELCATIGRYWSHPEILTLQPHNLVGHAFRSIVLKILEFFGDPALVYNEEVDPHLLYPGTVFHTRSREPRIDVVASRNGTPVALISARWRYRHDRVDLVDEAIAYTPAGRRRNRHCKFYAVVGEFAPNRLDKVLAHCPPDNPHPAINAAVHFAPELLWSGLDENGRTQCLKGLNWLIDETYNWQ
jgi:hypothetical protein